MKTANRATTYVHTQDSGDTAASSCLQRSQSESGPGRRAARVRVPSPHVPGPAWGGGAVYLMRPRVPRWVAPGTSPPAPRPICTLSASNGTFRLAKVSRPAIQLACPLFLPCLFAPAPLHTCARATSTPDEPCRIRIVIAAIPHRRIVVSSPHRASHRPRRRNGRISPSRRSPFAADTHRAQGCPLRRSTARPRCMQ